MTPNDIIDEIFKLEVSIGTLQKAIEGQTQTHESLVAQIAKFKSGMRQAELEISELKKAPIVKMDQFRLISQMHLSFVDGFNRTNKQAAEVWTVLARAQANLLTLQRQHDELTSALNFNNVLEFPTNDAQRSEETN